MDYSKRLNLLHALCLAETYHDGGAPNMDLNTLKAEESAHYLASFLTFRAIQAAGREPAEEYKNNIEMLSVYQCFGTLIFAFLTLPLTKESINPDLTAAQVVIAKTLFASLPDAELIDIIESGFNKFKLIGDAEAEHWSEFRENVDKLTVSFVIAGTEDDSPHSKEEVLPIFGQMLSQLCEAFET
ncbi:MAG: hypothetical protein H7Z20_01065 [Bdellovibrio sp.]|nr:hypothetical protein [Methylotenera sp.]